MQTREPWDHPSFFPYINRCILRGFHLPAASFLRTLSNHPRPQVSRLANLLATHLSRFPRSHDTTSYPLDHQFLTAHKQWSARFKAEWISALGTGASGRSDANMKGKDWEAELKSVAELMEGKAEKVLDEASDWREALGAWGVLVDPGLRRDDLS